MHTLPEYPITELVPGWKFRVLEISNGLFTAEGLNLYGHKISITHIPNAQSALDQCVSAARSYNAGDTGSAYVA